MESCHLGTSACPARDIPAIMVGATHFAAWRNARRVFLEAELLSGRFARTGLKRFRCCL
jgi:hypothetical protein